MIQLCALYCRPSNHNVATVTFHAFSDKLVLIIIRSYALNNDSNILYENDILHEMFISSQQSINTLLFIIL